MSHSSKPVVISLAASRFVQADRCNNIDEYGRRLAVQLGDVQAATEVAALEPERAALQARIEKQIAQNSALQRHRDERAEVLEKAVAAEQTAQAHAEAAAKVYDNAPADRGAILRLRDDLDVAKHLHVLKSRERAESALQVPQMQSPNVAPIPEVVLSACDGIARQVSVQKFGPSYEGEGAISRDAWARYLAMTASDLEWMPLAASRLIRTATPFREDALTVRAGLPKAEFIEALADFKRQRAASIIQARNRAQGDLEAATDRAASLQVSA